MHHFCPPQPLRKVKTDLKSARRDAFSGVSVTRGGSVVEERQQEEWWVHWRSNRSSCGSGRPPGRLARRPVARPGRRVRAVDQDERRDVAERVVDRHRRLPAAAARAYASESSRGSAVASGRRGAASLPDARKRLGGACGLGGGAFESSPAPGKQQEAAGGCRRSEIVLQQQREVGEVGRRRAASWSSIVKRESQRCSRTTCRRGGPGATRRSGLHTTARGHRRSFLTSRRLWRARAREREKLRAPGLVWCGSFSTLYPTRRQRGRAVQASLSLVQI